MGVGESWTDHFVTQHSDCLKAVWSASLEGARACTANPTNNDEWFKLLGDNIKDFDPDCIWAADETGIQTGGAVREWVLGGKGSEIQHQKHDGTHENITVIVTITADGDSIPPAIIFKGQAFLTSWEQENPLNAS